MDEQEQVLNEMIKNFYEDKQTADHFKKIAEDFNSSIKKLFTELNKNEFETDNGLVAKMNVQKRESFNEEKLLEKLKELGVNTPIKTIEVVDMDELENVIYNGQLDASNISDCREIKEVITLKVSKKKGV